MRTCFHASLIIVLCHAGFAAAQDGALPRWELGAGVATLNLPDYRGSDERTTYVLPVPYVIYRGERLRADREGIRGILFDSDRLRINLSLNGTLPVSDDDNEARRGMEDLHPTVEIGPTLDMTLWRAGDRRSKLDLRLPLRGSITVDSSPSHVGWLMYPNLAYSVRAPFGMAGWNMGMVAGAYIGDRHYHDYFYSVAPRHSTTARPAYQARGGYGGSQLTWTLSRRFPSYWVGAFARYDTVSGAVFDDSPLVKKRNAWSAGLAISWILRTSASVVSDENETFP